jgi:predicted phage terminase large subunit-like protein
MRRWQKWNAVAYQHPKSTDEIDLVEQFWQASARESFWAYRQYMRPKLKTGWFHKEMALEMEAFGRDLLAGKAPILLIQAPPQHGKSWAVVDFLSWLAGIDPNRQAIYASFSERLGIRANLMLQRVYDSPKYQGIFPKTFIAGRSAVTTVSQGLRNREILEYVGHDGYFRNTTVRGSITGEGMGLGVLDDPIKGREEANSQTMRDKTWDWMTDDFMTRFTEDAGILGVMTRWHVDDPFGRLIALRPDARVLRYPAIAERDEANRKAGDPLFPEHKSLDFLMRQKTTQHISSWEALYQQNPITIGGGIFKDEWWQYYDLLPDLTERNIYADTAQKTKQQNDYTVFECWGKSRQGKAVLVDMVRGKWEAPELLVQARAFWAKHKAATTGLTGTLRAFKVEDKVSGTGLIQTLKREGLPMVAIQRNVDKISRALDASPMVESGNVLLPRNAPWLSDLLAEASAFPNGTHDDILDPMFDAIADVQYVRAQPSIRAL